MISSFLNLYFFNVCLGTFSIIQFQCECKYIRTKSKVRVSPKAGARPSVWRVQSYTKYIKNINICVSKRKKRFFIRLLFLLISLRVSAPLRFISDKSVSIYKRKDAEPQSIFQFSFFNLYRRVSLKNVWPFDHLT